MQSKHDQSFSTLVRRGAGGAVNALAVLAIVLTLGLLAYAPIGPAAAGSGIAAAFSALIAGGLVYALLGSGPLPLCAPSSATALIFAGLIARLAVDPAIELGSASGLLALTSVASLSVVLMGVLQIVFGQLGLGRLAGFVPQPVLAGFMNGVALMILFGQLSPLLGLTPDASRSFGMMFDHMQVLTLAIGLTTAGLAWLISWKWPSAPATLLAMILGTVLYAVIALQVPPAALGPLVGPLPQGAVLPDALRPLLGEATQQLLLRHGRTVLQTALVLAVIGSLETLLAAAAIDQQAPRRHRHRRELMANGLANIVGGICGGLPLVLSRVRAMLLIGQQGFGRRVALAGVLAFGAMYAVGGPLLALLPRTVLAGVMLTVAVAMLDRWTRVLLQQTFAGKGSPDRWLSVGLVAVVALATIFFGHLAGMVAGVLLSMLVFIGNMNRSLLRGRWTAVQRPSHRLYDASLEPLLHEARRRITLLELEGALFFGSAERLIAEVDALDDECRILVLDLGRISTIDESGAVLLQQLSRQLARRRVALLLADVSDDNPHGQRLRAYGCFRRRPRDDWWPDVDRAIEEGERRLLVEAGAAALHDERPLAEASLMRGLAPDEVDQLRGVMTRQQLPSGEYLFRAGDPGDRLYLLTRGSISIFDSDRPLAQRHVSFSAGAMLGEMAMLDGKGRSASAVADSDSVVYQLTRDSFDALARQTPALAERLSRNIAIHLAERLRSVTARSRA